MIPCDAVLRSNTFTEIDHNYVNYVTDEHLNEVGKAFKDIEKWNKNAGYNGSYGTPGRTFNEYMTWSVFSLYTSDNDPEELETVNKVTVNIMVNGRGFIKYKEFNDKLLEIYKSKKGDEKAAGLYGEMLEWARLTR